MKVNLPRHEQYNRVRLTVNTPRGSEIMVFGEPHKVAELKLPEGVEENDVEVIAQYIDGGSRLFGNEFVLRSAMLVDAEPEMVRESDEQPKEEMKNEETPAEPREEDAPELDEGSPEPFVDLVEDAPESPAEPVQEEVKKHRRKRGAY